MLFYKNHVSQPHFFTEFSLLQWYFVCKFEILEKVIKIKEKIENTGWIMGFILF